jgi:hypothetical protein
MKEDSTMDTPINDLLHRLLDELAVEGIPDPLSTPFTLATLWLDLCQLAGEEPPVAVATRLDETWVATAAD